MSEMLAEGRKFGLALALAHQHMGQLTPSLRDALDGNASSVIAFRTSIRDAIEVAERFGDLVGRVVEQASEPERGGDAGDAARSDTGVHAAGGS